MGNEGKSENYTCRLNDGNLKLLMSSVVNPPKLKMNSLNYNLLWLTATVPKDFAHTCHLLLNLILIETGWKLFSFTWKILKNSFLFFSPPTANLGNLSLAFDTIPTSKVKFHNLCLHFHQNHWKHSLLHTLCQYTALRRAHTCGRIWQNSGKWIELAIIILLEKVWLHLLRLDLSWGAYRQCPNDWSHWDTKA